MSDLVDEKVWDEEWGRWDTVSHAEYVTRDGAWEIELSYVPAPDSERDPGFHCTNLSGLPPSWISNHNIDFRPALLRVMGHHLQPYLPVLRGVLPTDLIKYLGRGL